MYLLISRYNSSKTPEAFELIAGALKILLNRLKLRNPICASNCHKFLFSIYFAFSSLLESLEPFYLQLSEQNIITGKILINSLSTLPPFPITVWFWLAGRIRAFPELKTWQSRDKSPFLSFQDKSVCQPFVVTDSLFNCSPRSSV